VVVDKPFRLPNQVDGLQSHSLLSPCLGLENFIPAQGWRTLIIEPAKLQERSAPAPEIPSLTARMAGGDEAAYRQFYGLYFNRLLRYLLVLTANEQTAREAMQLTLLRVARHAKKFDSEAAFWGWLTVLARSSVVDESRKSTRYRGFLMRFFQHKQVETAAANDRADARLRELLELNVAALAGDERELIERKYFEGESVRQIAEQTKLSEKAIESRLLRVRRKLKEMILTQLHGE
jgi:RNA polymerase sigma factor (sigma-70 family)